MTMPTREDTQIAVDLGRKLRDDINDAFLRTAELAPGILPSLAHSASATGTAILARVLDLGNENVQDENSPTKAAFVLASLMLVHYGLGAESDPLTPAIEDLKKYMPDAKFNRERFGVASATEILATHH